MKTFIYALLLLSLCCFSSCNTEPQKERSDKEMNFILFLAVRGTIKLPYSTISCETDKGQEDPHRYGSVHPSDNLYIVLNKPYYICQLPYMSIYDKEGNLLDTLTINKSCPKKDCLNCKEYLQIGEDLSLYIADSISTSNCDEFGNTDEATEKKYVIYRKGKINMNGKIELSDTLRKYY
jgi:hypothetical protein